MHNKEDKRRDKETDAMRERNVLVLLSMFGSSKVISRFRGKSNKFQPLLIFKIYIIYYACKPNTIFSPTI
jgi:hypothetical protein